MSVLENALGVKVVKMYNSLKSGRKNWDSHWDEVAKFVIPRKDDVYGQATQGENRTNRLFDTEGIRANDELSAALHGMLTNPSLVWFGLNTGDGKVDQHVDAMKWYSSSVAKMIQVLNNSNFQTEIMETYQDLGSIGTNALRMEDDNDDTIRFHSTPIYGVVIDVNSKGDVDTVGRCYEYSARQILEEFKITDENIKSMLEDEVKNTSSKKHEIIQMVMPRSAADMKGGVGSTAFPFMSVHVLRKGRLTLKEGGFEEFPYAVPRWSKTNKELYGRSPAMKVLADIKMVNSMKKVVIQGAQLAIAPPLQMTDNGLLHPLNVKPYGTNYRRPNSDKIEPLFTGSNVNIGIEVLELVKNSIREAFLLNKLNLVESDRMTATEVIQRRDEQLRTLGPILGRLHRELLKPIIDRLFSIMDRKNMFDELPDVLKQKLGDSGGKLDIKYVSSIAQAQLTVQSENMVRALSASASILEFQPQVMDFIDGDALLKKNMAIYGVDGIILRSDTEVEQIRADRAEQQQKLAEQQQQLANAETVNKVGQVAGQTGQ